MDERFQGNIVKKQRITGLYFPFIITTIEFRQLVEEYLEVEEKVNWLLCFFYIIHNCSKQLLHQWWNSCSAEKRVDFFVILEMATVIFKRQIYHNPISSIIIHTTLDFVILYTNELQEANSIVLPHIFNVLKNLQYTNSTEMAQCLFHLFSILTNLCSKTLFLYVVPATLPISSPFFFLFLIFHLHFSFQSLVPLSSHSSFLSLSFPLSSLLTFTFLSFNFLYKLLFFKKLN